VCGAGGEQGRRGEGEEERAARETDRGEPKATPAPAA